MEYPSIIYPPNRPLERPMKSSHSPILYSFLFFIESNTEGEIILGCSSVSGAYWEGTLFHYKEFESTKKHIYNSYFISNSTTSDAKFILDNCILLAEDSGSLKILSFPNGDGQNSMECRDSYDKEDRIIQLATWNGNKFAACSEKFINLYEITNESSIQFDRCFKYYHTDRITSMDSNKLDHNLFVSTSADRKACIWDIRMDIPATVIYNNEFSSLTTSAWNPTTKDHIVIGSEAGDIYLLNIKQPKDFLSASHCFDSSVHRTCFNEFEQLAVCGNSPDVLIFDCQNEELKKRYESIEHNSIIRGLTWHKSELYSCGFNEKISSHLLKL